MRDPEQDNEVARDLVYKIEAKQNNKRAAKPVVEAYIRVQRLSSCAFFLPAHLFCFLIFLFLESVIG